MRTIARVGALVAVLWAVPASAADVYVIRDELPETGSNIPNDALTWPIPINRRYEELSTEQRRVVRDDYIKLGAHDEPPYPRDGMMPILSLVARIQAKNAATGLLHLVVRVNSKGEPEGVAALRSPDDAIAKAVASMLMMSSYKPALCDGNPCASEFSFKYAFRTVPTARNVTSNLNPMFWMPRQ